MHELADAYEHDAPQSKIDEITEAIAENHRRIGALNLPKSEKKKLQDRYYGEWEGISARLAILEKQYKDRAKAKRSGDAAMTPAQK